MTYIEDKDPLTGKGKRHTKSALAILGLSKSVIEERYEKVSSKGEIQDDDKQFWLGETMLQQGELISWNSGNYIAVIESPKNTEIGNKEYNVVMLEPDALIDQDVEINIDKILNMKKIKNEDKILKESDDVIIYWRDMGYFAKVNKMKVAKGKIIKVEKDVDSNGLKFHGFIKYKVLLSDKSNQLWISKGYDPIGYIIDVFEHVGNEPISSYVALKYKTDRIWRKIYFS